MQVTPAEYYATQRDPSAPLIRRPSMIIGQVDLSARIDFVAAVDYAIYKCPVRGGMSIALEDWQGRYWTGLGWHAGGSYTLYSFEKGERVMPFNAPHAVGGDVSCLYEAVDDLMEHANGKTTAVHMGLEANGEAGWLGTADDFSGELMSPEMYDEQRAKLYKAFDDEWGRGALARTLRAARARHQAQIRARKFKKRREAGFNGEDLEDADLSCAP